MAEEERSYWEVVEPVMDRVNIYDGPVHYFSSIAELPRAYVLLYATHMSLAEIHNGGFLQLFWNNTGIVVPEAIEGFVELGMPKASALLVRAAALLGDTYPIVREYRWDALLVESGLSEVEIEALFKGESNLYLAFEKATKALPFEELSDELLELADEENGGFQRAATQYAGLRAASFPLQ